MPNLVRLSFSCQTPKWLNPSTLYQDIRPFSHPCCHQSWAEGWTVGVHPAAGSPEVEVHSFYCESQ